MTELQLFDIHCKETKTNGLTVTIAPSSRGKSVRDVDEEDFGPVISSVWAFSYRGVMRKVVQHIRDVRSTMEEA